MKTTLPKTIATVLLSSTLLCLPACGTNSPSNTEHQSDNSLQEQIPDESLDDSQDSNIADELESQNDGRDHTTIFELPNEEAIEFDVSEIESHSSSFFVLSGDTLRLVDSKYRAPLDSSPSERGDKALLTMDSNHMVAPVLLNASAGDQLVTTNSRCEVFLLRPIEAECYYSRDMSASSNWWIGYDEIEGKECTEQEEVESVLKDCGASPFKIKERFITKTHWIADEPLSITCGGYRGTSWEETEKAFDTPCVITKKIDAEDYMSKVIKTKDGYFILNTTSFKPGSYILSYGRENGGLLDALRITIV